MQHLAIEVEYNSLDGSRKKKVLTSNSSTDEIANFVERVRHTFKVKDNIELLFKMKLTLENERAGNL